uniref:Uncharacterized protein n=1 Tax=Cyanistes caeruleus TaxID=156563 RepID=A0A8C0V7F9_CYACU
MKLQEPADGEIKFSRSRDMENLDLLSVGHRQKLEDQAKPFTDRYGELERLRQSMRVTPTTPNPRGSLSTPSHFGSQAQTPIQGNPQLSQCHPQTLVFLARLSANHPLDGILELQSPCLRSQGGLCVDFLTLEALLHPLSRFLQHQIWALRNKGAAGARGRCEQHPLNPAAPLT